MVFEHFEVSVSCSNNPLRPQLVHKYFRWGIKRIFLCVIGTCQKLDYQNVKKNNNSVLGVKKVNVMMKFYLKILGQWRKRFICHPLSSCDCVHRRDSYTFTQYCFDWEEHSIDTFNPHEDSPHLNKKLYYRAEESVRISALNIDQLWITIVTKLFDKTVFFLNHVW